MRLFRLLLFYLVFSLPLIAEDKLLADIPQAIQDLLKAEFPQAKFRLDGVLKVGDDLWLPIKPSKPSEGPALETKLSLKTETNDFLFNNGWIYTPIKDGTIKSYDYFPEAIQEYLLSGQIVQEFVVPEDFSLPRDLAMLAGRLPLKLRTVQLASDREVLYKERIKEEAKNKKLEFLLYSYTNGDLALLELANSQEVNGDEALITDLSHLGSDFSYISSMRIIDDEIYLVDQNLAKIFKLVDKNKFTFDATKPLQDQGSGSPEPEYILEEFLSLKDLELNMNLRDFVISNDRSTLYLLTSSDDSLLIVNMKERKLIKKIETPALTRDLQIVSRNASEPDKIIFFSKASSTIYVLNSFDHRISQEIDLAKIDKEYRYLPHSFLVTESNIFVAAEAISKKPSSSYRYSGKLLVLDVITGAFKRSLDLAFRPQSLIQSNNKRELYVQGSKDGKTYLSKIEAESLNLVSELELDADFVGPRALAKSESGFFLLAPSSATNMLGLVDTESWSMVKKLDLGMPSHLLLSI